MRLASSASPRVRAACVSLAADAMRLSPSAAPEPVLRRVSTDRESARKGMRRMSAPMPARRAKGSVAGSSAAPPPPRLTSRGRTRRRPPWRAVYPRIVPRRSCRRARA